MKGIVFILLADLVRRDYGEDTWDQLLDTAGLDGAYTSLDNYPDSDLMKLVGAASSALHVPPDDLVRWFGRSALPVLAQKFPGFFQAHQNTQSFLLTLNDVIHPEVRKLFPGADVPEFDYEVGPNGDLLMGYRSKRQLCSFGEGLIEGAAAHFNEKVTINQTLCSKRGDPKCLFKLSFTKM